MSVRMLRPSHNSNSVQIQSLLVLHRYFLLEYLFCSNTNHAYSVPIPWLCPHYSKLVFYFTDYSFLNDLLFSHLIERTPSSSKRQLSCKQTVTLSPYPRYANISFKLSNYLNGHLLFSLGIKMMKGFPSEIIIIIIVCLYSALSTSGEDSKRSSDNLYFALLSSISGPILGLYLCVYCLQGHTNLPESGPPIILESEPVMCSDRESNPGRLCGSPEG